MTTAPRPRSATRIATIAVATAAALALVALLAAGLLRTDGSGIDAALAQGKPAVAPQFDLEVLNRGKLRPELAALGPKFDDGRITNADLRGTPVVLNLWASWCGPCREEAPDLRAVSESVSAEGVLFLGLNSLDGKTPARAFVREHRLRYPNVREYENTTTRSLGAKAFPETFFLDARGRIVGHVIGTITAKQLRKGITAARTGRPIASYRGGQQRSS